MPARGDTAEFKPVFDAIREVHPLVPIFIFGMSPRPVRHDSCRIAAVTVKDAQLIIKAGILICETVRSMTTVPLRAYLPFVFFVALSRTLIAKYRTREVHGDDCFHIVS